MLGFWPKKECSGGKCFISQMFPRGNAVFRIPKFKRKNGAQIVPKVNREGRELSLCETLQCLFHFGKDIFLPRIKDCS